MVYKQPSLFPASSTSDSSSSTIDYYHPIVIGALGLIKKGTDNYLAQIPGTPTLAEIQKITLMGGQPESYVKR